MLIESPGVTTGLPTGLTLIETAGVLQRLGNTYEDQMKIMNTKVDRKVKHYLRVCVYEHLSTDLQIEINYHTNTLKLSPKNQNKQGLICWCSFSLLSFSL